MALLGELAVNLTARTSKFESGMQRASGSLKKFQDRATMTQQALGALKSAVLAGGALAAVRSLSSSFIEVAGNIDKVAKAADRLDISTETLGGLSHAAELSGSSFESLTKGIERMQRVMNDARQGTQEAAQAFDALGIDLQQITAVGADKQIGMIADALGNVNDQAEKMDVVQSIFGRGGAELINLLDEGAEGIAGMVDEFQRLGGAFTTEQGDRVEEFVDNMTRLEAAVGGLKTGFVIDVAPAASAFLEQLTTIIQSDAFKVLLQVVPRVSPVLSSVSPLGQIERLQELHLRRAGAPSPLADDRFRQPDLNFRQRQIDLENSRKLGTIFRAAERHSRDQGPGLFPRQGDVPAGAAQSDANIREQRAKEWTEFQRRQTELLEQINNRFDRREMQLVEQVLTEIP